MDRTPSEAASMVSGRSSSKSGANSKKQQQSKRDIIYEFRELIDPSLCERICKSPAIEEKLAAGDDETTVYIQQIVETLSVGKALGGYLPVCYYLDGDQEGFGRMKAEVQVEGARLLPYVYIQREIRGHLASKYYWDVDMVNCQPTILLQRLDVLDIESPLLKQYVEKRQQCLEEVQTACKVSRDAAKKLFLRLLYLGCPDNWLTEQGIDPEDETRRLPSWVDGFAKEMRVNARTFVEHPENARLRQHYAARPPVDKKNPVATMLSLLLQTEERKCVCALVEAICADGCDIGGIIHDGVHVAKAGDSKEGLPISSAQIKRWQHLINRDTGYYAIKLSVKPFERDPSYLSREVAETQEDSFWDDSFLNGKFLLPYKDMKEKWELRSFKVISTASYVREEKPVGHDNGRRLMSDKLLHDAYKHVQYLSINRTAGIISIQQHPFIPAWTRDNLIRSYKSIVAKPPPEEVPEGCYNTFNGFAAGRYRVSAGRMVDTDSADVQALIDFVHILCNRDQEVADYLLDWVAQILQQPSRKIGISIILRGDQGVGKNRFTDICCRLLGSDKSLETSSPQNILYGQYTSLREGRFLIVINEASGGDNIPFSGPLKDMITAPSFVSNAKYVNLYPMDCYARFIFTTNNDHCIKLEPGDRRFLIIDVSSELKDDAEFFGRLSKIIDDPHALHEFYCYLMQRDLARRTDWSRQRPHREGFTDMLLASLDYEYQFLRDFVVTVARENKRIVRLLLDELYEKFKQWLEDKGPTHGKHNTNNLKFAHKVSKLVAQGPRTKTGFNSLTKHKVTAGSLYRIDVPGFLHEMQAKRWITAEDAPDMN